MSAYRMSNRYIFTLVFDGIDAYDDEQLDGLIEAAPWIQWLAVDGESRAVITGTAASPIELALQALRAVRQVVPEARPTRVVEDLVSTSDVARRLGVSRETVRTWWKGLRGPGDFPSPRGFVSDKIPVWDWGVVSNWLRETFELGDDRVALTAEQGFELQGALDKFLRPDVGWCTVTHVDWQTRASRPQTVPIREQDVESVTLLARHKFARSTAAPEIVKVAAN